MVCPTGGRSKMISQGETAFLGLWSVGTDCSQYNGEIATRD